MNKFQNDIRLFHSKDGTLNLEVNGLIYYSKYNPKADVEKFLAPYLLKEKKRYIVFGLGLGYHVDHLLEMDDKDIVIVETNELLLKVLKDQPNIIVILQNKRVTLIEKLEKLHLEPNDQIIIIPAWHKSLNNETLKEALQEIIWLRNDGKSNEVLKENFILNIQTKCNYISNLKNFLLDESAILVSAGPSLDEQIDFLKKSKGKIFILAVGAAYKTLLLEGIEPDALVIEDPSPAVFAQVQNVSVKVPLFVASTVFPKVLSIQAPAKFIILQKGMTDAEVFARDNNIELLAVGGSVATMGFSLLIHMGAKKIIFVGQDLAYSNGHSHAKSSTSNQDFKHSIKTQYHVLSNNGIEVPTSLSWNRFRKFFEDQIAQHPTIKFYNTSLNGAVIKGTKYINSKNILLQNKFLKSYSDLIIQQSKL